MNALSGKRRVDRSPLLRRKAAARLLAVRAARCVTLRTVRIETERLVICSPELGDFDSAKAWCDPRVPVYTGGVPSPELLEGASTNDLALAATELRVSHRDRARVRSSRGRLRADSEDRGVTARGPEVEVVCSFNADHWGRGLATEAGRAMLEHGWGLGLTRIIALIHPDNDASANVARRLQMHHARDVVTASGNLRRLFVRTPG
jgi:RimJ/RimL family protein N-acetyltransferase